MRLISIGDIKTCQNIMKPVQSYGPCSQSSKKWPHSSIAVVVLVQAAEKKYVMLTCSSIDNLLISMTTYSLSTTSNSGEPSPSYGLQGDLLTAIPVDVSKVSIIRGEWGPWSSNVEGHTGGENAQVSQPPLLFLGV